MKTLIITCLMTVAAIQAMTVTGTVTDAKTGKPISGVLVMVDKYEGRYAGFNTQMTTDASGKYDIDYHPTGIIRRNDNYYLPKNIRYSLYSMQGRSVAQGQGTAFLRSIAGQLPSGVYLVGYELDGEIHLDKLVKTAAGSNLPVIRNRLNAKLAAAASLQTDTLISFSKEGYTTKAVIKNGSTCNIKLHPRTAIGTKPGPGNTGPTGPLKMGSGAVLVSGQTAEGYYFTALTITYADVSIKNFVIDGGGLMYAIDSKGTNLSMEDGEIIDAGGAGAGVYGADFTAKRLNIHEHANDAIKPWGNVIVEGCWIHHLGTREASHADGVQIREGSNFTFRKNHFEMPKTVPPPYKTNSNFIITGDTGKTDNVLIEDNWLDGGNYTIYSEYKPDKHCCGCPTNVRVKNNRFTRNYRYGLKAGGCFKEWSGNVWEDNGQPAP